MQINVCDVRYLKKKKFARQPATKEKARIQSNVDQRGQMM